MEEKMRKFVTKSGIKKTALCLAVTAALGTSAVASASVINFSWSGMFTMLTKTGTGVKNTAYKTNADRGYRTAISGTMSFNTATNAGTGTVKSFKFFSSTAVAAGVDFQAIGNGSGGSGTLVLGNMLFNWNGNNGIPVSIVLDAGGLFNAMAQPGFGVGTTIAAGGAGDATPASNNFEAGSYKIGPVPIATTTWNTTLVGAACTGTNGASCMGRNPSGQLPLIADTAVTTGYSPNQTGIGGNPMAAGPFQNYNANFDVTNMTVTSIVNPVPVPAAVWLLGSGLLGLVGVARRKRSDQS